MPYHLGLQSPRGIGILSEFSAPVCSTKDKYFQICTPFQVNRFFLVRYYGTAWYPRLFQNLLEPYSALLLVLKRQMDFWVAERAGHPCPGRVQAPIWAPGPHGVIGGQGWGAGASAAGISRGMLMSSCTDCEVSLLRRKTCTHVNSVRLRNLKFQKWFTGVYP